MLSKSLEASGQEYDKATAGAGKEQGMSRAGKEQEISKVESVSSKLY